MSQNRISSRGYVVGSNKNKTEWIVKVKVNMPPNPEMIPSEFRRWDGCKLTVKSVQVGTILRPGLDVTFDIVTDHLLSTWAYDVVEAPQVEVKKEKQNTASFANTLSFVAVENHHAEGVSFYLSPSISDSIGEARENRDGCVGDEDRVIGFFALKCNEPDEAVALEALVALSRIEDGAFARMLETVFGQIFNEAMTTYR